MAFLVVCPSLSLRDTRFDSPAVASLSPRLVSFKSGQHGPLIRRLLAHPPVDNLGMLAWTTVGYFASIASIAACLMRQILALSHHKLPERHAASSALFSFPFARRRPLS
jgi:hypothetical protein